MGRATGAIPSPGEGEADLQRGKDEAGEVDDRDVRRGVGVEDRSHDLCGGGAERRETHCRFFFGTALGYISQQPRENSNVWTACASGQPTPLFNQVIGPWLKPEMC